MQSVLLIPHPRMTNDAVLQALGLHFVLRIAQDIGTAREMLIPGQLVLLTLLDIHEHERIALLREFVQAGCQVIVVLPYLHMPLQRACALLGAFGLVENDCDGETLLRQINIVLSGQRTYLPDFLTAAIDFYYAHLPPLSKSHMAVLNAFLHQPTLSNAQISDLVALSEGRVRNIFTALYRKFNTKIRIELPNAIKSTGYFIGLNLIFPCGFNMHANDIKIVDGKAKYRLTS